MHMIQNIERNASIASITRGMKWLVFTRDPRIKRRQRVWKLKRESTSYVDAFMEMHSVVNDGMQVMVMVSDEESSTWEHRLNENGEKSIH